MARPFCCVPLTTTSLEVKISEEQIAHEKRMENIDVQFNTDLKKLENIYKSKKSKLKNLKTSKTFDAELKCMVQVNKLETENCIALSSLKKTKKSKVDETMILHRTNNDKIFMEHGLNFACCRCHMLTAISKTKTTIKSNLTRN